MKIIFKEEETFITLTSFGKEVKGKGYQKQPCEIVDRKGEMTNSKDITFDISELQDVEHDTLNGFNVIYKGTTIFKGYLNFDVSVKNSDKCSFLKGSLFND